MANLSEQDIRKIVDDQIRQTFGKLFDVFSQDIEYKPTSEAYKRLGYSSSQALRKAVENKTLRLGKEVQDRREPNSIYACYYFNIPACIKRLNTPPEKRTS